jgi:hypothetical protein
VSNAWAPAEVEKERSAIENDFGVKSVYLPAETNAAGWRRKRTCAAPWPEKIGI